MLDIIINELRKNIIGKDKVIRQIIIALLCKGHVLIEDVPGVGKTTIAKAIANVMDLKFGRIQFTPDLTPSDVLGFSIYNRNLNKMTFMKGPIHNNIILGDEINRTSPKTQSSLLEAMEEKQVTIDGKTYKLEEPFMVIATQNPVEFEGTFPLPEAQLDRFLMKLSIGYPDNRSDELEIGLSRFRKEIIRPQISKEQLIKYQNEINSLYIDETISKYIVEIVRKTREDDRILLGASPRGTIALHNIGKAEAYLSSRDYVVPEDVLKHIVEVLGHRIILKPETSYKGVSHEVIIKDIIEQIPFPEKNS